MSKRYTDKNKWEDSWFRKLKPELKCFWYYLTEVCDNSGVWEVDFEDAVFRIGMCITSANLAQINDNKERVIISSCGRYWLLKDFISFHIGDIYKTSLTNLQKSCIAALYKHCNNKRFKKEDFGLTGNLPQDYRYKDKKINRQEDKKIKTSELNHPPDCPDCFGSGFEIVPGSGKKYPCRRKYT